MTIRPFVATLAILLLVTPLAAQPTPARTKKDAAAKVVRAASRPVWRHVPVSPSALTPSDAALRQLLKNQQASVSKLIDALKKAGFDPKNQHSPESEKAVASFAIGGPEVIAAALCLTGALACHFDAMEEYQVCLNQDCPPGKYLSIGTCAEMANAASNNCLITCGVNDPNGNFALACKERPIGPDIGPIPPAGGDFPSPDPPAGNLDAACSELESTCKDSSTTEPDGDLVTRDCTFSNIEFGGCQCACVTVTAVGSEMIIEGSTPP
jgi:hypothetical protein